MFVGKHDNFRANTAQLRFTAARAALTDGAAAASSGQAE